jgi:hypothetical protein
MANVLKTEKKIAVISLLAEGNSIRATERITGVNQNTIMSLNRRVGDACKAIMNEKLRGLNCRNVEIDEIWGFVGAKRKNAERAGAYGDVWTFIALDADSKLIPSFVVGKRDAYHAKMFMDDLASRMAMSECCVSLSGREVRCETRLNLSKQECLTNLQKPEDKFLKQKVLVSLLAALGLILQETLDWQANTAELLSIQAI